MIGPPEKRSAVAWGFAVTCAVGAYALLFAWQGLDVTDEGFHLTNQALFLDGSRYSDYSLRIWLTDLTGALWMRLFAGFPALASRLGWVLTVMASCALGYVAATAYFAPRLAALVSLGVGLIVASTELPIFNYNSFPSLLCIAVGTTLLVAQRVVAPARRRLLLLAAGAALGAAGMARFPLFLFFPFLLAGGALAVWLRFEDRPSSRDLVTVGIGWAVTTLSLLLLLAALGRFGTWWRYLDAVLFRGLAAEHHSLPVLADRLWQSLVRGETDALRWLGPALGVFLALAGRGAARALDRRGQALWPILATLALYFWLRACGWRDPAVFSRGVAALGILFLAAAIPGALFARRGWLLFVAALTMYLPAAGSENGISNATYSAWLLFPLLVGAALPVPARVARWGGWCNLTRPELVRQGLLPGLAALALLAVPIRFTNPYRDLSDRTQLTAEIPQAKLRGIRTSAARARSFDALTREVERRSQGGEPLLAYDGLAMVHFVTGTVPAVRHPWPALLPTFELRRRLGELERTGLPRFVVRARVNVYEGSWKLPSPPPEGNVALLDEWVARQGYREVWSSPEFLLLAKGGA